MGVSRAQANQPAEASSRDQDEPEDLAHDGDSLDDEGERLGVADFSKSLDGWGQG